MQHTLPRYVEQLTIFQRNFLGLPGVWGPANHIKGQSDILCLKYEYSLPINNHSSIEHLGIFYCGVAIIGSLKAGEVIGVSM
jgi:hypothetical protein